MSRSELTLVLLCSFGLYGLTAGQYVCYRDEICSSNNSRPVFTLAESYEQCCGMPFIQSSRFHNSSSCLHCGTPSAVRVGPETVTLVPPDALVLEVEATVYSAVSWLYNSTAMHDFPRLALEEFSKRLVLYNTTATDAGVYEADVYPIGEGPVQVIQFVVLPPPAMGTAPPNGSAAPPQTLSVDAWPEREEINIHQANTDVTFMCVGTHTQMLTWTSSIDTTVNLNEYCSVGLMGEAPLDPTTQPNTPFPDYGTEEGSAIQPTPTDYSTDDLALGEALLLPSPMPVPTPDGGREDIVSLPPEFCSVRTVLVDEKNGILHSLLTVTALMLRESVTFTCTAESNATNASSIVELAITDNPFFVLRPHSLINQVISQRVVFECGATAEPAPSITWFRRREGQDEMLTPTERTVITNEEDVELSYSNLTLDGIKLADAGVYVCRASSNQSVSEVESYLHIRVPANITTTPENVDSEVASTAQLTCQSFGIPTPEVFWARVGTELEEPIDDLMVANIKIITSKNDELNLTTSNLTITDLQFADEGGYICLTTNGLAPLDSTVQRAEAYLTVSPVTCLTNELRCSSGDHCVPAMYACDITADCEDASDEDFTQCPQFPATIVRAPENLTVDVYGYAELTCESYGYPDVMVNWAIKEGSSLRLILPSEQGVVSSISIEANITTATLVISRAELQNRGEYVCLTNNRARVTSPRTIQMASAFLEVLAIPTSIDIVTSGEVVAEGGTLSLECHARATPTPEITWLRNDRPLTFSEKSSKYTVQCSVVADGYSVCLLRVEGALPGEQNDDGKYSCRLDNVVNGTTNVSATVSYQVQIHAVNDCVVNEEVPSHSPCLNNATCEDRVGGYMCICEGPFEGENCSHPVVAEDPPAIVEPPQDREDVEILEPVVFSCAASGSPQPILSWQKDGVFVGNTSVGELTVLEVRPEDRGLYTCTAHNQHGSSTVSAAGLLSIRGVYQYLVTFTDCSTGSLEELLGLMSTALSGKSLEEVDTTIYSFTQRPLPNAPSPSNQVIVTVVTGSGYQQVNGSTSNIQAALLRALRTLSDTHGCVFTSISRYDGCPMVDYSPNAAYPNALVEWKETDIHTEVMAMCPCQFLDTSSHTGMLFRMCGGTFSFGAVWEGVLDECDFTDVTYELCDITTLSVTDQFAELVKVTEAVSSFNAFDISVASLIVDNLAQSNEILDNRTHQERFAETYNNLLKTSKDTIIESQLLFNSSSRLLESLDVFTLRIQLTSTTTQLKTDLLQIQIQETPFKQFAGSTFAHQVNDTGMEDILLQGASISLPPSLVEFLQTQGLEEPLRVAHTALVRDTLFVFRRNEEELNKKMLGNLFISAALPKRVEGLLNPVTVQFYQNLQEGNRTTTNATCVFWEFPTSGAGYGRWSSEGCKLVSLGNGVIRCECNHLTHFGVLLAVEHLTIPDLPLEIITRIGIVMSLLCIAAILITYIFSRNLRKNVIGKMIINMVTPLGLFYIWFLLAIHGQYYSTVVWFCYVCSTLVQYFLLVYLCWTAVEAVHIYLKLVKVFGSDVHHYVLKSAVFAWGVPAIITVICTGLGIHYNLWALYDNNNSLYICYPTSWPLYFGVIVPFALIFIFNLILFVIIMVSLTRRLYQHNKIKSDLTESNNLKELRKLIIIGTSLSVLFGLGWVFGLVPQIQQQLISTISQYIFSIFVGFQGVFIFILHGVRSAEARKQWKRWFYKLLCCLKKPRDLISTSANSQVSPPRKTAPTHITSADRHSENPLYQSTDRLDQQESYSPVRTLKERGDDAMVLLPPSPIKLSKEVGDNGEAQIVEVDYADCAATDESSEEELDFADLTKVPFAVGEKGTAMGPDVSNSPEMVSTEL